ncbi:MAG: hypothetical protein ABSD74_11320 [Rhizomicrobium sp.]
MTRATVIRLIVILPAMAIGGWMLLASLGLFGHFVHHANDAPDWMGALIGFLFFAGALAALVNVIYGAADRPDGQLPSSAPAFARILSGALGVAVAVGLAIAFIWVGFGPGERHFSGSGAFLGPSVGRAMFGMFGLLTLLVAGWLGFRSVKRALSTHDGGAARER